MFEVGDIVPLSVQTYAADGVTLTDATPAPTCVITKPDRTTATYNDVSTPAVVHSGVGTYRLDFQPAAAGWGLYHDYWDAAGTQLSAFTDAFLVVDGVNSLLISLDDARAALRNPGTTGSLAAAGPGASMDEDLRGLIGSARAIMEDLCGPIIPRAAVETLDGGGRKVIINGGSPVISITSVQESWGNNFRVLTEQPLTAAGFDAYGYTVRLNVGTITRRTSGSAARFAGGQDNIIVTYVAGRAVMTPNLYEATRRLVRWLWQGSRNAQRPNAQRPETIVQTPSGYDVPLAVKRLCADDLRVPGIA